MIISMNLKLKLLKSVLHNFYELEFKFYEIKFKSQEFTFLLSINIY